MVTRKDARRVELLAPKKETSLVCLLAGSMGTQWVVMMDCLTEMRWVQLTEMRWVRLTEMRWV